METSLILSLLLLIGATMFEIPFLVQEPKDEWFKAFSLKGWLQIISGAGLTIVGLFLSPIALVGLVPVLSGCLTLYFSNRYNVIRDMRIAYGITSVIANLIVIFTFIFVFELF